MPGCYYHDFSAYNCRKLVFTPSNISALRLPSVVNSAVMVKIVDEVAYGRRNNCALITRVFTAMHLLTHRNTLSPLTCLERKLLSAVVLRN